MQSIVSLSFLSAALLFSHNLNANTLPKTCSKTCASTFGKKLGENKGIIGYSNCNNDCESDEWNIINIGQQAHKTGMKWQCVEYARRWYIKQLGYTFASIDHAYEIWDLEHASKLASETTLKWIKFPNGNTTGKPRVNDLLIYNKQQGIHGHVSVIVKVSNDEVYIAEQNYTNSLWEEDSYARKIPLVHHQNGYYSLKDLGVIGWMRLNLKDNQQ